ncbi:RlmE family RNA methyltransferase [Patescibacteria group bacterium]|nr:RlmE family RNA methyltransferase [Patescibacteria group bacterium]MBU2260007.1 RlmE family RNA methyltransferase [Patescibacteria group bacterium]
MPKRYIPNDNWSQKAQEEGYRARSVYKLKELDERFKLLKPGMKVLDLGAAPGSWLQFTKEKVGHKGKVIGMDLQEIEPIEDVKTFQQDITDLEGIASILKEERIEQVDLIFSDLAPATSGMKDVDQWKSIKLSQAVLDVARKFLKMGGICVIKVLRGSDFDKFLMVLKNEWKSVKSAQVKASRDRSKEIYLVLTN